MTSAEDHGQAAIWAHFQGEGVDSFAGAAPRLDRVAREVLRRAGPTARVLTVGIGNGHLERTLRSGGAAVSAIDIDSGAVSTLAADGFDARVAPLEALPHPDGAFDATAVSEVLEHLDAVAGASALDELARILRPGGWLVGTVPFAEDLRLNEVVCPGCGSVFHRWGHRRSFDAASLRGELSGRFVVERLDVRAFVGFAGRWPSPLRLGAGAARWAMGRRGMAMASPCLFFAARARS